jgi:hypothetical protein
VTIVAGFRANTGAVLAADSQEVISDYAKTTTPKIRILHQGSEWRVAIAGAADDGAYLELFQEELAAKLFPIERYDYDKMLAITKGVLHKLHKQHIWPQPDRKSPFQSLIVTQCVSEPTSPGALQPRLLETKETTVVGVGGFQSIGVGTYLAKYLEHKFLSNRLTMNSSLDHLGDVLVLMLKEVKKAIVGCDGLTSVALFYADGRHRWMTAPEIEEVEEILDRFERVNLNPLLALTDPSVSDADFTNITKQASAETESLIKMRSEIVMRRNDVLKKLPSARGPEGKKSITGRFRSESPG